MQKYIIKSFEVTTSVVARIYIKDEQSGNYKAPSTRSLREDVKSLMDFMCLNNSRIVSIERQPVVGTTRELFTIGDQLNNNESVQTIKIEMGEVKIYTSSSTFTLERATKYVPPTPQLVITEVRRGPGRPKKTIVNLSTGLDEELLYIQNRIEASFNNNPIRLTRTLKKRKETPEEFLYKFFTDWNLTGGEIPKRTVYINNETVQCECGKRRSLGDLYMILKYYYPTITIKDVLIILYVKLPARINNGFRTSKCSQIHKRVWYYAFSSSNTIGSMDVDDEYGKRYSWYQSKIS